MSGAGIGHNRGPSMEPGHAWRKVCWSRARKALLGPALPVEVIRSRVRRADELGLDYRSYASIRATTGHDVVAFLFSSNALRMGPARAADPARAAKIARLLDCDRGGLAIRPLSAADLLAAVPGLDHAAAAPRFFAAFAEERDAIRQAIGRIPRDRVVLVGETDAEAAWMRAGRLAGFIAGERYFAGA